jgi:murein DD-endopeptidase MepM/ murein hydrolase activator NlpD
MKYLILSLLIAGCASAAKNPVQKEITIRPGEARWIEVELKNKDVKLFCRDQEVKYQREGNKLKTVIIETYFSQLNPFTCSFKDGDQVLTEIFFKVENRDYKAEKLKVEPKHIKLKPKDQKRVESEQMMLNKLYSSSMDKFLFNTAFKEPMNSTVTSVYGTKRVYNGEKKGQHLGIDYRAAIGDEVPSTNAGKVVFAGDLFYTGWTVIIDHGLDIFSVYGHLSKPLVEVGHLVERGQIIGLSGNTGRTSGPHLHWGVKVQGQYIDGFVLIDETKKVFKE